MEQTDKFLIKEEKNIQDVESMVNTLVSMYQSREILENLKSKYLSRQDKQRIRKIFNYFSKNQERIIPKENRDYLEGFISYVKDANIKQNYEITRENKRLDSSKFLNLIKKNQEKRKRSSD
jgi:hypothetical protein